MAGVRDSSLLFSLRDLEALEQERLEAEDAARQQARQAAERARLDAERAARDAEVRRVEAEMQRLAEEDRVRREEAARLAALEKAAVERARAEVLARAEADRDAARRGHELELARARSVAERGRYRFLLTASAVTTLLVAAFAAFVTSRASALSALADEHGAVAAAARADYERSARELVATTRRIRSLEAELVALRARAEGAREEGLGESPGKPSWSPGSSPRPGRARPAGTGTDPPPIACETDGDPLNGCLKR